MSHMMQDLLRRREALDRELADLKRVEQEESQQLELAKSVWDGKHVYRLARVVAHSTHRPVFKSTYPRSMH